MTRPLLLIACIGFVMSVACLGGAAALGGRELAEHGWILHGAHVTIDSDNPGPSTSVDGGGPTRTREIAWSGGDSLVVNVPADVRFTQAPGPARLLVTGPKGTIDQLQASGGELDFGEPSPSNPQRMTIVISAPDVRHFTLNGDGGLTIAGYDHDQLDLELNGDNQVSAGGRARDVTLEINGDGRADLGRLAAERARVDIECSGRSTIAPASQADLEISGDGEIDLLSRPADLHSEVTGSGRIIQAAAAAAATSRPR
jgi:putative autotransporter adhesin-like protein